MTIICANCGNEMEVDRPLADGQHVRCPFCNEVTAYSKPARISLSDAVAHESTAPVIEAQPRPKLHIRRPEQRPENAANNVAAERIKERMRQDARQKTWNAVNRAIGKFFSIVFLLVILYALWLAWQWWQKQAQPVEPTAAECAATEQVAQTTETTPATFEQESTPQTAEKTVTTGTPYEQTRARFDGVRVSFWGQLANDQRPGKVNGRFTSLIPIRTNGCRLYELESTTNGSVTIRQIMEKGEIIEIQPDTYESLLKVWGGFIERNGTAYYVTAQGAKKTWNAPLQPSESFNPSESYFDRIYPYITQYRMNVSNLRFEVYFTFEEGAEPTRIGAVGFAQRMDFGMFAKAAEPIIKKNRMQDVPLPRGAKRVNQTVFLYDGNVIAQDVTGIVKVPRYLSPAHNRDRARWLKLRDEALRQESQIQAYETAVREAKEKYRKQLEAPITAKEIARVLAVGQVTIKRADK